MVSIKENAQAIGDRDMGKTPRSTTIAQEEFRQQMLLAAKKRETQTLSELVADVRTDKLSFLAGKSEHQVIARAHGHHTIKSFEASVSKDTEYRHRCTQQFCIALLTRIDKERLIGEQTQKIMNFVPTPPAT